MIQLRPYQQASVDNIRSSLVSGNRAPLLVLPTGGGKTVVFTYIAANTSARSKRVLILVHRVELLRQTSAALMKFGIRHGLINPKYTPDVHATVQVASVQTLINRLDKIHKPDLIIVDECFPMGTLIDGVPIENIKPGELVRSFNHKTESVEKKSVISVSQREYAGDWYRFVFSDGTSFVCTEEHPVYTCESGYLKAKEIYQQSGGCKGMMLTFVTYESRHLPLLQEGDREKPVVQSKEVLLSSVQGRLGKIRDGKKAFADIVVQRMRSICNSLVQKSALRLCPKGRGLLFGSLQKGVYSPTIFNNDVRDEQKVRFRPNEAEKSHAEPRSERKNDRFTFWPNILIERWKRSNNKAARKTARGNWLSDGASYSIEGRKGSICVTAKLLQGRFSLSRGEACNRSGWKDTQVEEVEVSRREKNRSIAGVRLDSVEVFKRGSGQRPTWVPEKDTVYNLHVKDNVNYFANGVLVHNCHHALANTWGKILAYFPQSFVLGVTATPIRTDGTGLGRDHGGFFDDMILGPSVAELIEMGFLVRPIVYAPPTRIDLAGVRSRMGDYDKQELERRMDKPHITGSAVEHYARLCPGTPAVAFCVSVAHAQHVAEQFKAAGFRAAFADGSLEDDTRRKILGGLGNGTIDVVTSCDLISEGTDIPAIGCAILLRPTQSTGLYLQQVGRALRPCAGKERAIILDHVGNVLIHGMPDQDRVWSLEGVKKSKKGKKKEEPVIKTAMCDSCFAVYEPAPACPVCGHVNKSKAAAKLKEVEGELVPIDPAEAEAIKKLQRVEVGRARTLEELQAIAESRGYKPGWARNIWKARQGKSA